MNPFSRRQLIRATSCAWLSTAIPGHSTAAEKIKRPTSCTLGFSTYGMKTLTTPRALDLLEEIGYDAVELTVRNGWDADSAKLDGKRRDELRKRLADSPLRLTSFMEHVAPTDAKKQAHALERLKMGMELAHDLAPKVPPLIQTTLGSGKFVQMRKQLRDRLGEWIRVADASGITIAIKPHRGGVVSKPSEAAWLLEQLGNPNRLRMSTTTVITFFGISPWATPSAPPCPTLPTLPSRTPCRRTGGSSSSSRARPAPSTSPPSSDCFMPAATPVTSTAKSAAWCGTAGDTTPFPPQGPATAT